jgi:hypothetical protein
MSRQPVLALGIRVKILIVFFLLLSLPLVGLSTISLNGAKQLGDDGQRRVVSSGESSVSETTSALLELAQEELQGMANSSSAETETVVRAAISEAQGTAALIGPRLAGVNYTPPLDFLRTRIQASSRFSLRDFNGKLTGETAPRYDGYALFDSNFSLVAGAGSAANGTVGASYKGHSYFSGRTDSLKAGTAQV